MRWIALFFLIISATVAVVLLLTTNDLSVNVNYLLGEAEVRLPHIILFTLMVGLLFGLLIGGISYLRVRNELRKVRKECKRHEQELQNLRALPVSDKI